MQRFFIQRLCFIELLFIIKLLSNVRNEFRDKLRQDLENIQSSKNILAFADKSTNLYELSKESYEKLLHDNIMQTYKKAPVNTKRKIDRERWDVSTGPKFVN